MKAIIQQKYGGPEQMELVDVPTPTIKNDELFIQIYATNVSSGDMRINTFDVPTVLKPIMALLFGFGGPRRQIRGIAASGVVVDIGSSVTTYKPGDEVYFINSMKAGCLAEYIALSSKSIIAKKPDNISHIEAAPLAFGAMSAYHFINERTISKGQDVMIYGASGSVGSYALQLAKYYGATVTAVSSSLHHKALLELGADHVIDYTTTDIPSLSETFDVIFDAVNKLGKRNGKQLLNPGGKYLSVMTPTKEAVSRLEILNDIVKSGSLRTLIDEVYPFESFKQAHTHTYLGHKEGNVVISVIENETRI